MTVSALLADLENRGIILFLEDGNIRYRSPKDALTDADRQMLRARKGEIIGYLKAREAGRALRTAKGEAGPLTTAMAQEMWWRFAGGAGEGKPVALNIGMVRRFDASPARLTEAIHAVLDRYEALRVGFHAEGERLIPHANDIGDLVIEQDSARTEDAMKMAVDYCGQLIPILGQWSTRAKVIALPDGAGMVVISSGHVVADYGARNIVIDTLQDWLDGAPPRAPSIDFNSYSIAERRIMDGPQGADLIAHWRDWYAAQPVMATPGGNAMMWGNGTRIVCNFTIPRRMMDRAHEKAEALKTTPFGLFMTLYAVAIARWAGVEGFALRVLGDKRLTVETAGTVGMLFCADAVSVRAPRDADFETILRGLLADYNAVVARRIPSLHYFAPQMVRPGIEPHGFPNRIPAVFNYFRVGTERERAEKLAEPDAGLPWPPQVQQITQVWPRVSAPLFLHLMDYGTEAQASLHFYADVVPQADRVSFTALLLKMFGEMLAE